MQEITQADVPKQGHIPLTSPGIYNIIGPLDFKGNNDNGFFIASPGIKLVGQPGVPSIINSDYSSILISTGGDDCTLEDVSSGNYNIKAQNGAACFFALPTGSTSDTWIRNLTVRRCYTYRGNGNGLRIGGVLGGVVEDNVFDETKGNSSEGITVVGSDLYIRRNRVYKSQVTGILVWGNKGMTYNNINIEDCVIADSSQAVLAPPLGQNQVGSNAAIEIQVNDGTIYGIRVTGSTAYDDQPTPTQDQFMVIKGTTGTIYQCQVQGNRGWRNKNPVLVSNLLPPAQFVDSSVQVG